MKKTLLTGSHLGFLILGKLKNYSFYVQIYRFYILCPNTVIIKQISINNMSYVYDSRPDCVLQQLINIIYAN